MVVKAAGADRVIFGSDMPLLCPSVNLGMIEQANLSKKEKELILGGNIARLLAET